MVTIRHGKQLDPGTGLPKDYLQARPLDKLKLSQIGRDKAASAAHLCLFQIQDMSPEEMMMGSAVLFATLVSRAGMDPEELFNMANRLLKAPDEGDHYTGGSLEALRDFGNIRVMGRDTTFW